MKKILILTAGFGDGHNAAARSLRDAIEFLDENARAEVLDLFADSYGAFNTLARKAYLGMVQYTPSLWGGIYSMLENPFVEKQLGSFTRLQAMLEKILNETQPDCVVSTYPIYGHVIKKIFHGHERPFKFITVVTDSITINSAWFRAPSDYFCVANDASAEVLLKGGVAKKQIKALGFPVNPIFADNPDALPQPLGNEPRHVLYIINTGKKKAGKAVDRLLDLENVHLTIAGRNCQRPSPDSRPPNCRRAIVAARACRNQTRSAGVPTRSTRNSSRMPKVSRVLSLPPAAAGDSRAPKNRCSVEPAARFLAEGHPRRTAPTLHLCAFCFLSQTESS
jgi:hypothetical protein